MLQTDCTSRLYMLASGGTTVWERWDVLRSDGTVNTDDLSGRWRGRRRDGLVQPLRRGAVGAWMYRRIAGIEAASGGYRTFRTAPKPGGGLTSASGSARTPYGRVSSSWTLDGGRFDLRVEVPVSTTATVVLPGGAEYAVESGTHAFSVPT